MSASNRIPVMTLSQPIAAGAEHARQPADLQEEVIALFDQLRERMLRYILGFGLPVQDAEEVVQDVFLALFQHLAEGKSRANLRAWVFRVAHNLSLKRRQSLSRRQADSRDSKKAGAEIADPAPGPEDQLAMRQRQFRLQAVLRALPELDRQCFSLRAEGLRYREIAEVLGMSLGSIANSLARSLMRLTAAHER
jgi:RNA polymerase sigma-70 factor (ECF subfamily)